MAAVFTFFLFMIYWSCLVQEERLQIIEGAVIETKEELSSLKQKPHFSSVPEKKSETASLRPHIDSNLPNLLINDPYFTKTLPELLGDYFIPSGILKMATYGHDKDFHPFSLFANVMEWLGYCQGTLGTTQFGKYETLVKDLAIKIEERVTDREDLAAFWVHLREGVIWQPLEQSHFSDEITLSPHFLQKHPVTAHDFQLYFQAIKNPHVDVASAVTLRLFFKDMESIDVIDDLTFVVNYKKTAFQDVHGKTFYKLPYAAKQYVTSLAPLAAFVYKHTADGKKIFEDDTEKDFYAKSSLWAQQFVQHFAKRIIVSCGAWIFDGANDRQIRFRRNPDYFLSSFALYDAIETYFVESPDAIWRDFMAQKIDSCSLFPQNLVELEKFLQSPFYNKEKAKGHAVERLDYLARAFSYIGWNVKRPLFSSKKVRQALAMAVDRRRLIQQNLNGQGIEISGPFFYLSSAYDQTVQPWPYDPDEAKRLLAEEGWIDATGSGVLEKIIDGERVPFRFTLTYYVKNPNTRANVELVASQLRHIGIDCLPNGVDVADISAAMDDKNFDAYYLAWGFSAPPENPEQVWHSRGANEKGSSNTIGFENKEADRLIELLLYEDNPEERQKLYHQFHALIHDEAPYLFLYNPKTTLVYWNWLHNIFIPKERQDLIPGATVEEPSLIHGWKKNN